MWLLVLETTAFNSQTAPGTDARFLSVPSNDYIDIMKNKLILMILIACVENIFSDHIKFNLMD